MDSAGLADSTQSSKLTLLIHTHTKKKIHSSINNEVDQDVRSQSADVWLAKRPATVEQHVGARVLHWAALHLSDHRVVKVVPRLGDGVVTQRRVVTHVKIPSVVLEKESG